MHKLMLKRFKTRHEFRGRRRICFLPILLAFFNITNKKTTAANNITEVVFYEQKKKSSTPEIKKIIDLTAYFSPITKESDLSYEAEGKKRNNDRDSTTPTINN